MTALRARLLIVAGLLASASSGCGQPEPPPALVGDGDSFTAGRQLPTFADASDLYFYYSASDGYTPVDGPPAGLYRVAIAGGTPTRLLPARVLHTRRQGDDLIMLTQGSDGTEMMTWPLGSDAPTARVQVDPTSVSTTSDGDYTYVMASDTGNNGHVAITRLATDSEPEQTVVELERAFVYDPALVHSGGYLYWMQSDDEPARIATDGSQTEHEILPDPPGEFPIRGIWCMEWSRLIGVIDGQVYGLTYVESFFATGGYYDNGDPRGYNGFGGGAIYTVAADAGDVRTVAADIRYALIVDGTLYAQTAKGATVTIDPRTGAQTELPGRARPFDVFENVATNHELLFYTDRSDDYREFSIRYVSLTE